MKKKVREFNIETTLGKRNTFWGILVDLHLLSKVENVLDLGLSHFFKTLLDVTQS